MKTEVILKKKNADAFVSAMEQLSDKFSKKYLEGNLEDYAKLNLVHGKLELTFIQPVPDMVRYACIACFVNTLL